MAILLTGFFGMFRLGELVWPDEQCYRMAANIPMRSSLRCFDESFSFEQVSRKRDVFYQRRPVTVQKRKGIPGKIDACIAMMYYYPWRDTHHNSKEGPLFLMLDGRIPTRRWFIDRFTAVVGDEFSGHSLRAGGATWLASTGVSKTELMIAGRWGPETFLSYIRKTPEFAEALDKAATLA